MIDHNSLKAVMAHLAICNRSRRPLRLVYVDIRWPAAATNQFFIVALASHSTPPLPPPLFGRMNLLAGHLSAPVKCSDNLLVLEHPSAAACTPGILLQ